MTGRTVLTSINEHLCRARRHPSVACLLADGTAPTAQMQHHATEGDSEAQDSHALARGLGAHKWQSQGLCPESLTLKPDRISSRSVLSLAPHL